MIIPAGLFFCTALLYASVGFGGGSTYNAILVLFDANYKIIPFVSLACNIVVVIGGVWYFSRHGGFSSRRILPWILFSMPASFIGGSLPISEVAFIGILGIMLLLSGIKLLLPDRTFFDGHKAPDPRNSWFFAPVFGTSLGLMAGLTGIGGGIFLAPVLYFLHWGNARQIAGACSLFILMNSLAGITGQVVKLERYDIIYLALPYAPLLPMVFIGGQIGSYLGAGPINQVFIRGVTAILILYVAVRLLIRFGFSL
ncbi:sulfite exporter TauE/SafE family protein [Micavibrio aeruginosavorus]|uniref:Probable membrane transporter protein n=1 Tax=Micavibrio aeruginosavorus EPB TaxID=349215 RepID=M4VHY7_9BACT|nr:sulfite exporter TauE/SafE family protein [Micavibrio aeruginosavorus]AGH97666.1 putative sulfoacetate exporter [Micavibrio aeruginosavorus EPB]